MSVRVMHGDCLSVMRTLPDESVHCIVTSPPYFGLRDYGIDGQIGLEATPDAFIGKMVEVFREARRVLRKDGTCWLNLGDSYAGGGGFSAGAPSTPFTKSGKYGAALKKGGIKPCGAVKSKDLLMIPSRVAIALQADGWWLRSEIIWSKPNPMPESVTDRPTCAHEKVFLLTKNARYWYDAVAVRQPMTESSISRLGQDVQSQKGSNRANGGAKTNGPMKAVGSLHMEGTPRNDGARWRLVDGGVAERGAANLRNVWTIATKPFSEAHFATFPPELAERCIKAGCPTGGTVLDPFGGAGTTGLVADRLGRDAILIELNPTYADMAMRRIERDAPLFAQVSK